MFWELGEGGRPDPEASENHPNTWVRGEHNARAQTEDLKIKGESGFCSGTEKGEHPLPDPEPAFALIVAPPSDRV